MYSYFSILSYTHNSLLIFCSSIYIFPSSPTSSSIKSATCNSRFFFTCWATRYWRSANITCRTPRSISINAPEFAGKDNNEIASFMYSSLTFFYTTLNVYLVLCIFLGRFLTLCMKTYYTAFIVYHLSFLGKSFRWFWYYCFSHLYYTCLLGFFWVAQTKNHLKELRREKMLPTESA